MKRLVAIAAALAMVAPSVATARPAVDALSLNNAAVQPVRAAAKQDGKKMKLEGENGILIALLAAAAVIAGIIIIADGSNEPTSP
ncbi:MAG: hypothetical protein P8J20_01685 [Novosphingobium sp.]|nr:hypothetical protein [Novosphingobium sp.]